MCKQQLNPVATPAILERPQLRELCTGKEVNVGQTVVLPMLATQSMLAEQSRRIRFDLNRSAAEARVQMGKQTCRICSSSSNSTEISSSMLTNIEVPCIVVQSKQCKWGPSGLQILYLCSPRYFLCISSKQQLYVHQRRSDFHCSAEAPVQMGPIWVANSTSMFTKLYIYVHQILYLCSPRYFLCISSIQL